MLNDVQSSVCPAVKITCGRRTMQDALDRIAPEGTHYRHLDEGMDDMPAHVKVRDEAIHVNTTSGCTSFAKA